MNGDRDMKKVFLVLMLLGSASFAKANDTYQCQYAKAQFSNGVMGKLSYPVPANVEIKGSSIKVFRPDGTFLISPPLKEQNGQLLMIDDGSKVYASSSDKSNFAVSDKISKVTEQWDECAVDFAKNNVEKTKVEMSKIEKMNSAEGKKYFLNEKHAFTTNCLVWDDVTMITGPNPAMLIAGSVNMGKNPHWNGKEYSFNFNGGSMIARFTPSEPRHKLLLQAGDKFYGCGPSEIDHNYD